MKRILILLVFLVLASSAASAADWANRVSAMTQGQGRVDRLFDGPEGMTGIVIGPAPGAADNGKILAWGMPGGLLVVGNVYDRNGRNLSEVVHQEKADWFQSAHAAVEPSAGSPDPFWEEAMSFPPAGRAVSEGQGERVFVFTESGCKFCKRFFEEVHADPNLLKKFEIVWVPVTRDGHNFRTGDILNGDLGILKDKDKPVNVSKKQEKFVFDNSIFLQEGGGKLSTPAALVMESDGLSRFYYGIDAKWLRSRQGN